jgi:agmatine deiminase
MNARETRRALQAHAPAYEIAPAAAPDRSFEGPLHLPAQWEPAEAVIVRFPVLYGALWETHAQMIEAISQVARADVLVPAAAWVSAIDVFLRARERAAFERVRYIVLATDDLWVRDFGPFIGYTAQGERAAIGAVFDPLPAYPQALDAAMAARYAALRYLPFRRIDLHTEGGNFWSDGQGTLLVSVGLYERNPHLSRAEVEHRLSQAFAHQRLLVTPSLWREETGHVDLLVKWGDARTLLVAAPTWFNQRALHETAALLRKAHNAAGEPFRTFILPMPRPYLNWGIWPVWRSYTNALTVNGRVLVPVFGIPEDSAALATYQRALPQFQIVPIMCAAAANGGGAVHCLTKEVPAARGALPDAPPASAETAPARPRRPRKPRAPKPAESE